MPAKSKAQQRLMGVAYAVKKGDMQLSDVDASYKDEVKDLVDNMSLKSLKKYAATKHEGLPERVPENIQPGQVNGMGPVVLPADGLLGSGDVPAGRGDAEEEYKKKKKKMSNFEEFVNGLNKQVAENSVSEATVTLGDLDLNRFQKNKFKKHLEKHGVKIEHVKFNSSGHAEITYSAQSKEDLMFLFKAAGGYYPDGGVQWIEESKLTEKEAVEEAYAGTASDFKYEFPNQFEDVTGFSDKAIKGIRKKGKNGYEVRTSTYAGKEYMEAVGKQMGLEIKKFEKHSNMCITVYESVDSTVNEWGSSDQSIMNKAIHNDAGKPKQMPSPFDKKLRDAAESAVDFYWDDWEEYETDRDGLIDDAVRGYLRQYFKKDFEILQRMFQPMESSQVTEASVVSEIRMSSWGELAYTEDQVNTKFGWCGTLAHELGEDKAMFLTHQSIHELQQRALGLTVWEALAILNSTAGRHAAEAYLGGESAASDALSALIWYFGSKSSVAKHAKQERKLQFPNKK